jgi:Fic family protein
MQSSVFSEPSGILVERVSALSGRSYACFIPNALPPRLTEGEVASLAPLLSTASQAFGQLSGIGKVLPNPDLLVRPYMRREAILSSRIENTYTSFSELVAFEATGAQGSGSTREVARYVTALDYGLRHVHEQGITTGLICEIHRKLLQDEQGSTHATPGQFRNIQNHIGGGSNDPADARYVPPPVESALELVDQLVAFISAEKPTLPVLIEAALMHYQFEAIHPFLDGNGRVGRVLIPVLFSLRHGMEHPLLYLSPYFERDRNIYYDQLFEVSSSSDWLGWIRYFLQGILEQAQTAVTLSERIIALGFDWHRRLDSANATLNAHRLADFVHQHMAVDARLARINLGVSPQTSYNAIEALVRANVLVEYSERSWGKVYVAHELRDLMEAAR